MSRAPPKTPHRVAASISQKACHHVGSMKAAKTVATKEAKSSFKLVNSTDDTTAPRRQLWLVDIMRCVHASRSVEIQSPSSMGDSRLIRTANAPKEDGSGVVSNG
mmetsp:Transcript_5057/g.14137  ORF Transcript_5057/g.14137 Transcript_5057/m.14137 type:complete len:105 (+) Transcript_5057:613-927(+)